MLLVAWAAEQNAINWVAYKNRNWFLTLWTLAVWDLGARPVWPDSVEGPLTGCKLQASHGILTWLRRWGLFWGFMSSPCAWPNHLPKAHLQMPSFLGLGFQRKDSGDTDIKTTAISTILSLVSPSFLEKILTLLCQISSWFPQPYTGHTFPSLRPQLSIWFCIWRS